MQTVDLQRDRIMQMAENPVIGLRILCVTRSVVSVTAGHLIVKEAGWSAAGSPGPEFWS